MSLTYPAPCPGRSLQSFPKSMVYSLPWFRPWPYLDEWHMLLGDIIHLKTPAQHIVVLGSTQVAVDLLDKRSETYSNRPQVLMNDLYVVARTNSHNHERNFSIGYHPESGTWGWCNTARDGGPSGENFMNTFSSVSYHSTALFNCNSVAYFCRGFWTSQIRSRNISVCG